MKKPCQNAAFRIAFLLLVILAMTFLGGNSANRVQAQEQIEDNDPGFQVQAPQVMPDFLQGEDNTPGNTESVPADLIVMEPEADVRALIADATNSVATQSNVIPAAAFSVDSSTRQWFFGFNSAYLSPTGAGNYCGIAPVYLPNGAEINAFAVYLYDNDAGESATAAAYLYAKPLGTMTSSTTMASVATSTQSTSIQALADVTIASPVVDNSTYTYHIGVCLWGTNSDLRFYAAQILYTR